MVKVADARQKQAPDELTQALKQVTLSTFLAENLRVLTETFQDCSDLIVHTVETGNGGPCCILFLDGLVNKDLVDRDIIGPLLNGGLIADPVRIAAGRTSMGDARVVTSAWDAVREILGGNAVLLIDGEAGAISYGVRSPKTRAVSEPVTEPVIRGPREGFVETLRINTALLRRKIGSPALKLVALTLGRITQTNLAVAYVEGVANPTLVAEVLRRLRRIEIDGVLEGAYLEELIEDNPFSPFPQVQNTERPDTAAAQLLEGRVAIMVDGTPFVLIVLVVFAQLMQSSEDYYERFQMGAALLLLLSLNLRLIGEFFLYAFLPRTPIIGIIAALAAWGSRAGIEVQARVGQVVFPLLIGSILLIVDRREKLFGAAAKAQIWQGAIWVIMNIVIFGILGREIEAHYFPFYAAARLVQIADFLERIDALFLAVWLFGMFLRVGVILWAAALGTAQWLGLRNYRPLVLPLAGMAVSYSIAQAETFSELQAFLVPEVFTPFSITFVLVMPMLLLAVAAVRHQRSL